ncbi:MAG: signal peptidase I [Candidatus Glassbacteria bacterium]|nr:signal peptidase I [Candidatus Glassbacteria bacterium]
MKEWAKSLGLAFILFLIIRIFLVQAFTIPTGSMERTLLVGDYLLVNKMVYGAKTPRKLPLLALELPILRLPGLETPRRGEIVVFEYPKDRDMDFVKRCVAVGSDTVEMRDKVLYINSIPQSEPYIQQVDPTIRRDENRFYSIDSFAWQKEYLVPEALFRLDGEYRPTRDNFGPLVVPEGKYFCLGDNRDYSNDSRFWGFVDERLIKGRPLILYYSWNKEHKFPRFGRIGQIIQ